MSATAVKERPILFSGEMVKAILDGRKTMTRRICKVQPGDKPAWAAYSPFSGSKFNPKTGWHFTGEGSSGQFASAWPEPDFGKCPYGKPGERLWVKESLVRHNGCVVYAAKYPEKCERVPAPGDIEMTAQWRWQKARLPSIHCPRWASRITLEIVSVRVERLNQITRGDCMSEGCPFPNIAKETDPKQWYVDLWQSINGPGSWDANPFVWCISFKRLPPCAP